MDTGTLTLSSQGRRKRVSMGWCALAGVAVAGLIGVVGGTMAPRVVGATSAPPISDGATVEAAAVRFPDRVQIDPIEPPPPAGGCLVGSITTVSASTDALQRWRIGNVVDAAGRWKSALYAPAGVRGPVVVVGDSLTLASMNDTMRALVNAGYGPVCIDGGVSRRIPSSSSIVSSGVQVTQRIKASDPVWRAPEVRWVVAFGTNDTRNQTSRYASLIQTQLDAIGPTTFPVCWMNTRTLVVPYDTLYEPVWNALLHRPGVRVIDWWSAIDIAPTWYIGSDSIHATPLGSWLRAQLILTALSA